MKSLLAMTSLLTIFAVTCSNVGAEKPRGPEPQLAKRINTVTYEFTTGDKPELVVTASATVPTGGYKAELRRLNYVNQPEDGIQDYELYLTKPDGIVIQVISEAQASNTLPAESAAWLRGVRVRGEGDGIVVKLLDRK
jgi:hypothetical protein